MITLVQSVYDIKHAGGVCGEAISILGQAGFESYGSQKGFVAAAPAAAAPVAAAPKPTAPAPVQRIKVDTPDVPVKVTKNGSGDLICPACGTQQRDNRFRCLKCGVKFINGQPSIPYWCGSCGQEGPFEGACPKCNSTVKIMNIHQ
ncbi:MAG: hypothetical protein II266_05995 [Clostridia bacterium]|nr:hypothetical protein [Clostridia bacterium]